MSTVSVPREACTARAPRRHPITVAEYLRMGETGVLDPDLRVELIEGEPIDMAPIGPTHAGKTIRLIERMSGALRGRALVSAGNPLLLGRLSAPQPDLALLRLRDDCYEGAHPGPEDCLLLIEVADTSLTHDRRRKLPLYARFGVREVWIIDIRGRRLESSQGPEAGRYPRQVRIDDLSRVGITALPGVTLDLTGLF